MACELTEGCPYFNARNGVRPQVAALFRARYCRGNHQQCARYAVYDTLGRAAVPVCLAPNEHLRALMILRGTQARIRPVLR